MTYGNTVLNLRMNNIHSRENSYFVPKSIADQGARVIEMKNYKISVQVL
jgi:hypothetical protein